MSGECSQVQQLTCLAAEATEAVTSIKAFDKDGLIALVDFEPVPHRDNAVKVVVNFINSADEPLTSFICKAAVPKVFAVPSALTLKYVTMELGAPTHDIVLPNEQGVVTQEIILVNNQHGTVRVAPIALTRAETPSLATEA